MICSLQQLILNCCSVGFSVFYRLYNKRKLRGTNEMTSEWNYKNLNSARNGPSDEGRGETDVFVSYRWSEDIDRQHNWSAFSLSRLNFFFFNSTCALFFDSNFKISTRVFFFFREHIFCKSRLIFFIKSDVAVTTTNSYFKVIRGKFRLKYYVFNMFLLSV